MAVTVVRHSTVGDKIAMVVQVHDGGVPSYLVQAYQTNSQDDTVLLDRGLTSGIDRTFANQAFDVLCEELK